jgi:hypothetical protein
MVTTLPSLQPPLCGKGSHRRVATDRATTRCRTRRKVEGAQGTVVKPLDDSTLSLVGSTLAGKGSPSGAATFLFGRYGFLSLDLVMARLGRSGRGKRERRKGGAGLGCVPGSAPRRRRHCRPRAPATMATHSLDLACREGDGDGG